MNATQLRVGDRVRLTRATRTGMVPAGSIGTVVEIRDAGKKCTDGVSVEFMRLPTPRIARMFGNDPAVPQPFRCLFPAGGPLPLVALPRARTGGMSMTVPSDYPE